VAETPWTCIRRGGRHVLYMRSMRRLPTGTSRVRRRPTSGAEDPARSINGAKSPCYQWWSTLEANLLIREALRVICRDRSWEVLVLYRERSGGKSLENGGNREAGAFSIQRLEGSRFGTVVLWVLNGSAGDEGLGAEESFAGSGLTRHL